MNGCECRDEDVGHAAKGYKVLLEMPLKSSCGLIQDMEVIQHFGTAVQDSIKFFLGTGDGGLFEITRLTKFPPK